MFIQKIKRFTNLIVLAVFISVLAGCGDSKSQNPPSEQSQGTTTIATLPPSGAEFNLSAPLPNYVVAKGLSAVEHWGRWSDSDQVVFTFGSNLPKKFALTITARAYGPNAGIDIPVKVGSDIKKIKLSADVTKEVRIEFVTSNVANSIEITVPKPTVPKGGDLRPLGIAFGSIKIEPLQ